MHRYHAPQQKHHHCSSVEAETQCAPLPRLSVVPPAPHGQDEHRWEIHRQQHQWEDHHPLRTPTLAKQSEKEHHFPDHAHQNNTAKTSRKSDQSRGPHQEPHQLLLFQNSKKQFKMTELISPECLKNWLKQPNCPHNFRNWVLSENLLKGTSDEVI